MGRKFGALSAERRALLESMLAEEGIERAPSRTITPREDRTAPAPLAFSQSRFWFLDQFSSNGAAYVISAGLKVHGEFSLTAFGDACRELVRRHEALRTIFYEVDGRAVQQVRDDLEPEVRIVDRTDVAPSDVDDVIAAQEKELISRPFDLGTGPLFRVELIDFPGNLAAVLVNLHHIVSDRWSMGVLMRELTEIYGAFVAGLPSTLPDLEVQYADFALWQNGPEAQAAWAADREYWLSKLDGSPAELGLPTTRPRPKEKTYRGSSVPIELPPVLVTELRAVAKAAGATPFMVLTAAVKALLSRLAGNEDVVVGTPVANRTMAELEPLVGLFVNTLTLRTDLSGDPSFRELVGRVQQTCLEAYEHQHIPFERLAENLKIERSLAHTPVFQVLVSYQNVPFPSWDAGPVRAEPLALEARKAEFDLLVDMFEDGDTVWGRLEYSTDVFDEAAALRLVGQFERLVRTVLADPDRRLSELSLVDGEQRRALVVDANATEREWAGSGWVHECVAEQAARTPDAEAVHGFGQSLTYAELDARANQVAQRLVRLGVGPEVLVGVALERSPDLLVGLLAVLKAGGAGLALNPRSPRLATRVEEAEIPLVLTHSALGLDVDAELLEIDDPGLAAESAVAPPVELAADDLASIRFTAGGTGLPHAVELSHGALRNRLLWLRDAYGLVSDDRVLHSPGTPVTELFWPLLDGAAVVFAEDDRRLGEVISAHGVTTLQCVPARLEQILREPDLEECYALRRVIAGGEPLTRSLQRRYFARTDADLHNHYGLAETTGGVLAWTCRRDGDPRVVPIGGPIANTQVYVLDEHGHPVPPGVPGELHVAGRSLARGYLDQDELTAQWFVPNPFTPGDTMLRTGDRARYRDDGAVEFLGRMTDRTSVRGFHVDPAEVEAELAEHPQVREAVVLDRGGLVGYVTGTGVTPETVLAHAKERLPEYLVPSSVVVLDELPLNPGWKLDRAALPDPVVETEADVRFTEPRNDVERWVADTFRELLGADRVGAFDDFFSLGGHSLLITKLASHIKSEYGVAVAIRELFDGPTVAAVAARITGGEAVAAESAIPAFPGREAVPLSFAQEELCVHQPVDATDPFHNVLTALVLKGELNEEALRRTLDDIVARHTALRARAHHRDGVWTQSFETGGGWPVEFSDLSGLAEQEREMELRMIVEAEERLPFVLDGEPLVRATLVKLSADEHALLQVMHHLVTDNWSYGVLFGEMREFYEAHVLGREPVLPPIDVEFPDVAAWQQNQLAGGGFDEHRDYWRDELADLPPTLRFTAPAHQDLPPATGATQGFALGSAAAKALKEIGHGENATLFMVLLAAFDVLLSAYSGSDDVPVDFPLAGRDRPETEHLIGYFVNHLVVRAELAGGETFRDLVRQVRERTLGAYAHQSVPVWNLDVITETNDPGGISFNLLNADVPSMDLHGLHASPLELNIGDDYVFSEVVVTFDPAAIDLALIMREDQAGDLRGMWLYATERVDARAVSAMTRVWPDLIEAVASTPDIRVGDLRDRLLATELSEGRA